MRLATRVMLCLALMGCEVAPEDDAFARQFVARLHAGDSSVTALLEPNSKISADSGRLILRMRDSLPAIIDTLRLVEWSHERDAEGGYRTLTYVLEAQTVGWQAKLWLVGEDNQRFVNTFMLTRMSDR